MQEAVNPNEGVQEAVNPNEGVIGSMEEGRKKIDLPYLKDVATSTIIREGYFSAEYNFWKEFLKDSKLLLTEFEHRTDEAEKAGETTISWANFIPGCCLSKTSMKQQYLIALTWAHDCIEGICNYFKKTVENCKVLKSLAESIVVMRQQTLDKYDSEIQKAKDDVTKLLQQIENRQRRISEIRELMREMRRRIENSCVSSHDKKHMRRLDKESKQAMLDVEKLRVDVKEAEQKVKQKEKDKQFRMRVLALWRSIHVVVTDELRKLDPTAV